ncbi:MAG TPA: arylsulfatase [Bryobacteraceae bacterium]|nr:arylsulfatase [Bryobacteraceae bacterium]
MNRRSFLSSAAASAVLGFARTTKPNIVFILADDLGYGDLGCYGQKRVATPNIDALAASGMRFTQFYCGSTVCAPSRCALMTGKHLGHARIRGNARVDLLPEDLTVPEVMKKAGYRTALIGKWGLGTAGKSGVPNKKGFDEFYGFLDQKHAHTQYPTQLWENEEELFLDGNFGPNRKDYVQEVFTARALGFLERTKTGPFFLYLSYTTPHANNELTRQSGNGMEIPGDHPYTNKPWPQPDRNFAGVMAKLDGDVGRVMAKVKELGIEQDTLVLFASDNGPHKEGGNDPEFFDSNGPLRGIKRDLYEGGIRTPFLASWPGVIRGGQVSDAVCAFWDILPTLAELGGAPATGGLDGISIVPALHGRPLPAREYLYWEFHEGGFTQAARIGNWKGVRRKNREAPIEIYDLSKDPGEQNDVATAQPALVKRVAEIFQSARTDSPTFPVVEKH